MATKPTTLYSDNPKMDRSGITAERPVHGYMGNVIDRKKVTGGKLYMESVKERESMAKADPVTSQQALRRAAEFVNQGLSCDHAVDIVQKDKLHMPDKVDVLKSAIRGMTKAG